MISEIERKPIFNCMLLFQAGIVYNQTETNMRYSLFETITVSKPIWPWYIPYDVIKEGKEKKISEYLFS